jgi:hypothetical protein
MPTLPALISRPVLDAVPIPPPDPAVLVVKGELSAGLPVRVDLDTARVLLLAVPLGMARAVLAADPSAVVFDTGVADPLDLTADRDHGGAWPRLTLVVDGAIGDTVPVVRGVPFRLAAGPAVAEVTVDELVITAGTLRSPGRFDSRLSLRWRDLTHATDDGPPRPTGDPGIPLLITTPGSTATSSAREGLR